MRRALSLAGVRLPGGRHLTALAMKMPSARGADRGEHCIQQSACLADEGLALLILFRTGTFSDHEPGRPSVTNAGYGELAPFAQTAGGAIADRPLEPAPIQAARRWRLPRAERRRPRLRRIQCRGHAGALQAFDSRPPVARVGGVCGMAAAATSRTARNRPRRCGRRQPWALPRRRRASLQRAQPHFAQHGLARRAHRNSRRITIASSRPSRPG